MRTLPPGGGRRTASLGAVIPAVDEFVQDDNDEALLDDAGSPLAVTLAPDRLSLSAGISGRRKTIPTPVYRMVGTSAGTAFALAVGDIILSGNALLLENGDDLLLETGDRLLIEDASSPATAVGIASVRGIGAAAAAAQGTSAGIAVASGVMDAGASGDKLLLESGDDILMEDGSFLLLETGGVVVPATALIEAITGQPLLGAGGEYLVGV